LLDRWVNPRGQGQRPARPPEWGRPNPNPLWRRKGPWVVTGIIGALLLGGCLSNTDQTATQAEPTTATVGPTTLAPPPPSTSAPPPSTIQKATVPKVVGMKAGQAKTALSRRGLRWTIKYTSTSRFPSGTVISQSKKAGAGVLPDTAIALVIAKAPPPPPTTAPRNCDPAYPDVCLHDGIGDYDCAAGTGNGPNYVEGPIRVLPPDPFDLDGNGDGIGCERG
jgi:hypothetical protein